MKKVKPPKTSSELPKKHSAKDLDENTTLDIARTVMRPSVQAAVTLKEYGKPFGEMELGGLIESLNEQIGTASKGDLGRAEAMLTAQAHTLDAIFNNLARRAALTVGDYMPACETYLKLALRAQAQCRATLEALAEMKQPKSVAYVGQANIAQGYQQVNNASSQIDEKGKPQNKLLEEQDGERLDTRTACKTGKIDSQLETVGAVHRTKNGRR